MITCEYELLLILVDKSYKVKTNKLHKVTYKQLQ